MRSDEGFVGGVFILFCLAVVLSLVGGCLRYRPEYAVWSAEMDGKAEMARAEQNRQIKVREAEAERDSAKLKAEAEIERAKGVAKSNEIVSNGLGGPEGYLRYLYIQQLGNAEKNERTVIYVPTNGMLPVTESSRATEPHKTK